MASAPAASPLMSIEEYLASSFHADLEFVDGVLEEKTVGDWNRSFLQSMIGHWFLSHRAEWKINVLSEYRTRTSKTRVRLPDICVVRQGEPVEPVRVTAPLLCIEMLSPDDRPGRVMKRRDDFVAMGAEHLWILDPADRSAAIYSRFGLRPVHEPRLTVPDSPIYLDIAATFATLDEPR